MAPRSRKPAAPERDAVPSAPLPQRWERPREAALALFSATAGGAPVHLYAAPETGEAILRALSELPGHADTARRLRAELEETQAELEAARAEPKPRTPRPDADGDSAASALGAMISAPFRVSPAAASAARTEPLAALAVQVARALAAGASDLERARLIAMAFAATRGDMDAFWTARKQRGGGKKRARA